MRPRAPTWPGSRSPRSAPGGCGRPGAASRASCRAISRRTPSNADRTTALGVSSMMKSTPVRFSSARMLRPSRPMIRPFMSSDGQLHDGHRRLGGVAGRQALHRDRQDRAHAALGLALGLVLDLAQDARLLVARIVLDLLEQRLPRLPRAEAGDALERRRVLGAERRYARLAPAPGAARGPSISVTRRSRSSTRPSSERSSERHGLVAPRELSLAAGQRAGRSRRDRRGRRRLRVAAARACEHESRPRSGLLPGRPPRSRSPSAMTSFSTGAAHRAVARFGAYVGREEPDRAAARSAT